jgi:hypothetical protein
MGLGSSRQKGSSKTPSSNAMGRLAITWEHHISNGERRRVQVIAV